MFRMIILLIRTEQLDATINCLVVSLAAVCLKVVTQIGERDWNY